MRKAKGTSVGAFLKSLGAGFGKWTGYKPLLRVALVEDNADSRSILNRVLSPLYKMDIYSSGVEALAGLEASPPDAVLLDICLPDMDGVEVLARIRGTPSLKSIPVIAITAYAMAGDQETFLRMGFDDYTSKPIVDTNVLFNLLDKVLKRNKGDKNE